MKFPKLHSYIAHVEPKWPQVHVFRTFYKTNHVCQIHIWVIVLMMEFNISQMQSPLNSGWPVRVLDGARELTHCEGLGYPNATKNECGYCTLGNTGLSANFGKDCKGKCGGSAVMDCDGVCGGTAYTDECSGECIGGNTGLTERDIVNSYRDCRGYCLVSGGQFYTDSCGVCNSGTSPFEDCTNKCHLPGQEHLMAKLLCGRCVGGTSSVSESDVLDACGQCRSEGGDCICNGTGSPDPCGICNGGGKSCMRVLSFFPQAAPNRTDFDLFIRGAFRGRLQNLRCLLTAVLEDDELGKQLDFPGGGNGTHLKCRVRLSTGLYRVGASIEVGENPEVDNVEDAQLLIYENADYEEMTPSTAVFDREVAQEIVLAFSKGRVPKRPLTCLITGEGWPSKLRLSRSRSNSLDTCVIPYANTSTKLKISPSLNGVHPFKKSFSFTFYASPPEMKKYFIAEDGHAVVIVFDRPVNLCKLETCSDMLNNDTITRLGGNATCKWATKQQLVITVQRPISGNPIRITFKRGVLIQDNQQYAYPKSDTLTIDAWYPQPSSSAQLAISGPSTVPFCGTFTLVGHFSSPKGEANFYWTANRVDRQRLEDQIANALLACRVASLVMDTSLLEVDMNYTFILTAEHPGNAKYEARHVVGRKAYIGPLVTAYSDVMSQPSVSVNQMITLQADVTIPNCGIETETVHIMWSVDDPEVKFDFSSRNSQLYKIMPFSLPENTVVSFAALAYFGNLLNVTSSKITLRVEPLILRAAIKGSSKRMVGNMDGVLVLESDESNGRLPLVYQWRCFDENRGICYNYNQNATNAMLITREMQKRRKLEVPLNNLKAGQTLTFELQVFNANNRYQSSPAASVVVEVENGNIPEVVIQSIVAEGIGPVQRHPSTGAYNIPARLPVTIHATVKSSKKIQIKSMKWDIKGFSRPFSYSTVNENTYLSLEEDFLVDHGIYLVGLSACSNKGACGVANLTIHAVPGVTLCELVVKPFVEYEEVEAMVKGCSVPAGRQPLTYQLYMHLNNTWFPISPPQTSTTFNFFGPPVPHNKVTQLSVQVCDKTNVCKLFDGPPVKTFESEVRDEDTLKLFDQAVRFMKTNNPTSALSLFLTAAVDRKLEFSEDHQESMINCASKAIFNRYVNSGQLDLIYSAMLPLLKNGNKDIKLKALAVMRKATTQAFAHKVRPPTSVLAFGHGNVIEALSSKSTDADIARRARQSLNVIVECISRNLPLGGRKFLESKSTYQPTTLIFRKLIDKRPITVTTKAPSGKVEGTVAFEDEVREKYQEWKCEKSKNCDGAVVSLTLYPGRAPYPSDNERVSPVFDVSIRNPSSGRVKSESFKDASVRIAVSNTGNITRIKEKGSVFKCFYWNENEKEWSQEGVMTMGTEGNSILCWASHLSTFAVFEVYEGLSTSSLVGIIVAVLMGVFIIGMLFFVYLRKKQAKATRVSTEAIQPKQVGKLQGMERTVAHVKRLTN